MLGHCCLCHIFMSPFPFLSYYKDFHHRVYGPPSVYGCPRHPYLMTDARPSLHILSSRSRSECLWEHIWGDPFPAATVTKYETSSSLPRLHKTNPSFPPHSNLWFHKLKHCLLEVLNISLLFSHEHFLNLSPSLSLGHQYPTDFVII